MITHDLNLSFNSQVNKSNAIDWIEYLLIQLKTVKVLVASFLFSFVSSFKLFFTKQSARYCGLVWRQLGPYGSASYSHKFCDLDQIYLYWQENASVKKTLEQYISHFYGICVESGIQNIIRRPASQRGKIAMGFKASQTLNTV